MSTIVKETASGRVERIDPLHPTHPTQLGRSLEEVSEDIKSNQIGAGDQQEALDVPPTAAATGLLVDGGKTEDPRHGILSSSSSSSPTSLNVDTGVVDKRTEALEAEARAEAARQKEAVQRTAQLHSNIAKEKVSHLGLQEKTKEDLAQEQQQRELKAKYPQIDF